MEKENFAFTKILFEAKVKWLLRQKKIPYILSILF